MYKIFADDTLIYDSTLEDYRIGKGVIEREVNKSGSFTFSVYPDHFFYDGFVAMKTVITVYKSGRIVFRGRVLNDVTDYWNNKVLTCEGELGFLQDSVARPFAFQGKPADLFRQFIEKHNEQVGEAKRFKVGKVTVVDANDYVNRSSTDYRDTLNMMASALTGSDLGGYIHITHGDDGTDPIPTVHYLADFETVSSQDIEFGANLRDYTKTTNAADIATAIVPLGTQTDSDGGRLTIKDVNGGVDYVYSPEGVALRDWIFKTVVWDDVTLASNLKAKAEAYLEDVAKQNITIELNAIDLHLLDRAIESFNVCEYVRVTSTPHQFDAVLLCNRQTMDLLKPENDTVVLGYRIASLTGAVTGASAQMVTSVSTLGKTVTSIKQDGSSIKLAVEEQGKSLSSLQQSVDSMELSVSNGEASAVIKLRVDGEEVSRGTIEFTGDVVFASDLQDGETVISGDNIKTGLISADRIKLGGEMNLYESLDGDNLAGVLGYSKVTVNDVQDQSLGFTSETSAHLFGKDYVYVSGMDGVVMSSNGNFLYAGNTGTSQHQFYGLLMAFNGVNTHYIVSDRRAKTDIDYDQTDKLIDLFDRLAPVTFHMKDFRPEDLHAGFIVQDVEAAAVEAGLAGIMTAIDSTGTHVLNYGEITAVLTAKVQQLEAKIKELTA